MVDDKTIIGESLIGGRKCPADASKKSFTMFITYIILGIFSGVFLPMILSPLITVSCTMDYLDPNWYANYLACLNAIEATAWISYIAWILATVFGLLAVWEFFGKCTLPYISHKISGKASKTEGEK